MARPRIFLRGRTLNVYLDCEVLERLRTLAHKSGKSMAAIIRATIAKELETNGRSNNP